jgi:putative ABC transport system substrate-binding protein
MNRRDLITLLGGAAAAWPVAMQAQQGAAVRRVGLLMFVEAGDSEATPRLEALRQGLQQAGWTEGRNLQIDIRWSASNVARARQNAAELVALAPDVILAAASQATAALQEASRNVPIVFVNVTDPVGAGYVASLAKPGGNITGFMFVEYGISGKWLELLREIVPSIRRVAVVRDPTVPVGIGHLAAIQSAAPSYGVEVSPIDVRDAGEIERAIANFARSGSGALIVTASPLAIIHREKLVALAAQYQLPAVYFQAAFARTGGLISYGPDPIDSYRRAASYVDRILRGEKPADMPVQAPTKFELAINNKTAKALGLTLPPMLLARATEVIE